MLLMNFNITGTSSLTVNNNRFIFLTNFFQREYGFNVISIFSASNVKVNTNEIAISATGSSFLRLLLWNLWGFYLVVRMRPKYILLNYHNLADFGVLLATYLIKGNIIVDVWDKWPYNYYGRYGILSSFDKFFRLFDRFVYTNSIGCIYTIQSLKDNLTCLGVRHFFLNNLVSRDLCGVSTTTALDPRILSFDKTNRYIYAGSIGYFNAIPELRNIFLRILEDSKNVIVFVGNLKDIDKLNINHPNLIILGGFIPFGELRLLMNEFTFGILSFSLTTRLDGFSSSKYSLYRSCGLEVLANFEINEDYYIFGDVTEGNESLGRSSFYYESHVIKLREFIDGILTKRPPNT